MKKNYVIILVVLLGAASCKKANFLDDKSNTLDDKAVFSDSTRTLAFLSRMYEDIGFNFNKARWENGGTTEESTDDAEYGLANPARRTVALYGGFYSADNMPFGDAYTLPWVDIRRANLLLRELPVTPLSPALRSRVSGEARFIRAYFYTYFIINFGGAPIIGNKVFGNADIIDMPRNTFEECVNYAVKEFDSAAILLPAPNGYPDADYGRITKGACMAMKARLLLFAASPLFNGGAIPAASADQKKLVSYPAYDASRWQAAADAATAVINSGYYSLYVDNTTAPGYGFYKMFLKRVNPEYILFVNRAPNRDMENEYNPASRGGSKSSWPTQNIVDCFPMKNGLLPFNADGTINAGSGYDPSNPYVNRDPRFGNTIIYNGSSYYLPSANGRTPVFTYQGAPGGDGFGSTPTGYWCRKMCDADISNNSSFLSERGWPLLRYAEILLDHAEAINETGQTALAYPDLIALRGRAGIDAGTGGMYGLKPGMTIDEMRAVIHNERHIELAYEGDSRWDDMRRWKIAEAVNNAYNRCMKITKISATAYTYTPTFSVRRHNFRPEMYLFPFPTSEIRKVPAMLQNPGW